jgi:hypothetical protein
LIEAPSVAVDVVMKNIGNLISNIRQVREEWEKIFSKSTDISSIARISAEFKKSCSPALDARTRTIFIKALETSTGSNHAVPKICHMLSRSWAFTKHMAGYLPLVRISYTGP